MSFILRWNPGEPGGVCNVYHSYGRYPPERICSMRASAPLQCLLAVLLTACGSMPVAPLPTPTDPSPSSLTPSAFPTETSPAAACPVTEPAWVKPPEDSAVQDTPGYGYYYVNEDRSIWAAAWWTGVEEEYLRVSEEGIKTGWFRPAGETLEITGRRMDGEAPPLDAHVPCCYPTRFQATGLYFPTGGCWEVTAKIADSELTFVVWVEP
jgi:hypothetical protein